MNQLVGAWCSCIYRSCPHFHDTPTVLNCIHKQASHGENSAESLSSDSTRPESLDVSVNFQERYLPHRSDGPILFQNSPHPPEKHMKPYQDLLLQVVDWTFLASSRLRWAARPRSTQAFNFALYLDVSLLSFPSIQLSKGESKFDGNITQFMFMYLWIQVWKCSLFNLVFWKVWKMTSLETGWMIRYCINM